MQFLGIILRNTRFKHKIAAPSIAYYYGEAVAILKKMDSSRNSTILQHAELRLFKNSAIKARHLFGCVIC